jgi:hypothetical protein
MGSPTQSALANSQFIRHFPVVHNFVAAVVNIIVNNQFALLDLQEFKTLHQAVEFVTVRLFLIFRYRQDVTCKFFPPNSFADYVTRHSVEIPGFVSDIRFANLGQPLYDAIDSCIGKVLSIAEAFGNKNTD